ncbi:MAG TPA: hypothetical protein PKC09_02610 [Paracoccus sp. (in: a-proteobacteria)]|uniref:hypothetical protein n=1 Tax=uncultured Paracoccus sp. TaxID=189685 RepID=UPI00262BF882|nr:hypothetical protein [uncultured Paracoccus sp.]HMQ40142.1 hypothetical protein [Paracoccus sp. (in: a-proteobacteria)]HMR35114.1 hypothetical protein [Paracoccus sp. (in: a-proteobacteria)]
MTNSFLKRLSACLAGLLYRLEVAEEGQVNSDFAVSLMEEIIAELQGLDAEDLADFIAAVHEAAADETNAARKSYLSDLPDNFGLQDNLS